MSNNLSAIQPDGCPAPTPSGGCIEFQTISSTVFASYLVKQHRTGQIFQIGFSAETLLILDNHRDFLYRFYWNQVRSMQFCGRHFCIKIEAIVPVKLQFKFSTPKEAQNCQQVLQGNRLVRSSGNLVSRWLRKSSKMKISTETLNRCNIKGKLEPSDEDPQHQTLEWSFMDRDLDDSTCPPAQRYQTFTPSMFESYRRRNGIGQSEADANDELNESSFALSERRVKFDLETSKSEPSLISSTHNNNLQLEREETEVYYDCPLLKPKRQPFEVYVDQDDPPSTQVSSSSTTVMDSNDSGFGQRQSTPTIDAKQMAHRIAAQVEHHWRTIEKYRQSASSGKHHQTAIKSKQCTRYFSLGSSDVVHRSNLDTHHHDGHCQQPTQPQRPVATTKQPKQPQRGQSLKCRFSFDVECTVK